MEVEVEVDASREACRVVSAERSAILIETSPVAKLDCSLAENIDDHSLQR